MKTMRFIAGVAVAVLLATAGTASAERKRVGVPKFEGPGEAGVRGRVAKALRSEGFEPVGAKAIDNAMQDTGASLDSESGVRKLAKELSCVAFVTGEISAKKARLTVHNGADGAVSGEAAFSAANPKKLAVEVGKAFWRRLGSAVQRGRLPSGAKAPPKASAAEPEEENAGGDDDAGGEPVASRDRDRDADRDSDRPSRRRSKSKADGENEGGDAEGEVSASAESEEAPSGLPRLEAAVGFRGFSRNLTYNQDRANALRGYKLSMGPAATVDATLYLSMFSVTGALANLGATVDFEQGFAVTSQLTGGGAAYPTTIHDFAGGVRYRIPVGNHQIIPSLTGGEHAFTFRSGGSGADRSMLLIPDTIYRYLRPGVEARIEITPAFSLLAGAAYRYVFNGAGQIRDGGGTGSLIPHFPHLTVAGVDANIGAAYKFTSLIEARVVADLRRYFYDMHSVTADLGTTGVGIAGGAVDQYLSIAGMLAFQL